MKRGEGLAPLHPAQSEIGAGVSRAGLFFCFFFPCNSFALALQSDNGTADETQMNAERTKKPRTKNQEESAFGFTACIGVLRRLRIYSVQFPLTAANRYCYI